MKKKNKLSRIGSALLAIILVIAMAGADVLPALAAETKDVVDVEEGKDTGNSKLAGLLGDFIKIGEDAVIDPIIEDSTVTDEQPEEDVIEVEIPVEDETIVEEPVEEVPVDKPGLFKSITDQLWGIVGSLTDDGEGDDGEDTPSQDMTEIDNKYIKGTIVGNVLTINSTKNNIVPPTKNDTWITACGTEAANNIEYILFDIKGEPKEDGSDVEIFPDVNISPYAFYGSNVKVVLAKNNNSRIKSIGRYAFYNCHNLEFIDTALCEYVDEYAFTGELTNTRETEFGVGKLNYIDLSRCTVIGPNAFAYQEGLIYIKLPSLASSGINYGSDAFKTLYCYRTEKANGESTLSYYQDSQGSLAGKQVFKRTYVNGGKLSVDSWMQRYNREVEWDDTELIIEVSDNYIQDNIPTISDFYFYQNDDYSTIGVHVPELQDITLEGADLVPESILNILEDDLQKLTVSFNIPHELVERYTNAFDIEQCKIGTAVTNNYKIKLRDSVTRMKADHEFVDKVYYKTMYLNTVTGKLTDLPDEIFASQEYKDAVGVLSMSWSKDGETYTGYPFTIGSSIVGRANKNITGVVLTESTTYDVRIKDGTADIAQLYVTYDKNITNGIPTYSVQCIEENIKYPYYAEVSIEKSELGIGDSELDYPWLHISIESDTKAKESYVMITGEYRDKDGSPMEGYYVVLDNWNTGYAVVDNEGAFRLYVPKSIYSVNAEKLLTVYFTNLKSPGTGKVKQSQYVATATNMFVAYEANEGEWSYKWPGMNTSKKHDDTVVDYPHIYNNDKIWSIKVDLGNTEAEIAEEAKNSSGDDEDDPGTGSGDDNSGTGNGDDNPGGDTPSTGDNNEEIYATITGSYVNEDGTPIVGSYVVLNNWDKKAVKTDATGAFTFSIPKSEIGTIASTYNVYFTNVSEAGTGDVAAEDYVAKVSNAVSTVLNAGWTGRTSNSLNTTVIDGVTVTYNVQGKTWGIECKVGDTSSGDEPGSDEGPSDKEIWGKVTGYYKDKDNKPMEGYYVVLNNWSTHYAKAGANGYFEIPVYTEDIESDPVVNSKEWSLYFTTNKTVGSGTPSGNAVIGKAKATTFATGTGWQNPVIETMNSSNCGTTADGTTWNVTCTASEFAVSGTDDSNKEVIHGNIVDKDGVGIGGLRLILADANNKPISSIVTTNADGYYEFTGITDSKVYLFILSTNYKQGTLFEGNWNAKFPLSWYNVGGWSCVIIVGTSNEAGAVWNPENISVNANGSIVDIRIGSTKADITAPTNPGDDPGNNPGDDPTTEPEIEWSQSRLTITGKFLDKNGTPIDDKYIALDNWGNAKTANSKGVYTFYINDEKTHRIYFTNLKEPAENNTFSTNDIVNYITFQSKKDETGYFTAIMDTSKSSLDNGDGTVTEKLYGSKWLVNVNTKFINNDIDNPEISGRILSGISVALDGVTGTTFTPYVGRKISKEEFVVTARYKLRMGKNPDYVVPSNPADIDWDQYYIWSTSEETIDPKDWTCDKLVSTDGIVVTKGKQSLIFAYTYNNDTAKLAVTIDGTDAPVASVKGVIRNADGKGLANYVCYLDVYENSTLTDSDGSFSFEGIIDGSYDLFITKSKKVSSSVGDVLESTSCWYKATINVSAGKPTVSNVKNGDGVTSSSKIRDNEASITIVYDEDTTTKIKITGTFKSSNDKPITDQYIVLDSWSNAKKADSKGKFEFNDIGTGTYTLHFTNQNKKGTGNLTSNNYDFAKVKITIDTNKIEAKATTYDGTTANTNIDDDGNLVIDVKLSETSEEKSTSNDTETNQDKANSTVTAGKGKVTIKGTVTDTDNKGISGLGVVIDDYSKAINTSSTGAWTINNVDDGGHTVVIHKVSVDKLEKSGKVSETGDNVWIAYTVNIEDGKIKDYSAKNNGAEQFGAAKESDDTIINLTTILKAGTVANATSTGSNKTTVSGNSTGTGTTALLPKTGLDFLEQAGITDGIAKMVGYDSPIVAMLTPAGKTFDSNGNLVDRVDTGNIENGRFNIAGIIAIIVLMFMVGGAVWYVVSSKRKEM